VPELLDDDLMRMVRDGDADAFDALFDRYRGPVYNFARMMLSAADGAEDVLQETFLAVARTARRYEPRGRFRAWLMRIARNLCLNRIEGERVRRRAMRAGGLGLAEPPSREPTPAEQAEADEQIARVRERIAELPERQREAIVLYAFERMSYRDIGETLGVPLNTVKTLIHRARATLARAFE
jgi:RNA polymerase sigma-70 factor (ECF subfamily)